MGLMGFGLAIAVGCGSTIVEDPGTTTGSGGTTASSGTGGLCEGFADEMGTAAVTVRFRNETGLPIYLPSLCSGVSYSITPTGGSDGTSYRYDGSCLQTCEDLQTDFPIACGPCAPTSYLVPAGSSLDVAWDGTGLRPGAQMPAACFAAPDSGGTCSQVVAAPSGTYRAEAMGFEACGAECTCNAEGVCNGQPSGLQAYADPVMFDFPAAGLVEVVFGVCAFGCAGG